MLSTNALIDLFMFFPALRSLSEPQRRRLEEQADPLDAHAGQPLPPAVRTAALPLVTSGAVRVVLGSRGRRFLLCRVGPGQACALRAAALIHDTPLPPTTQHADGDLRGACLAPELFHELYEGCEAFRSFIAATLAQALGSSAQRFNQLLFVRIEQRLAQWLLEHARAAGQTQQGLAEEVGTTREVVGRALKRFEAEGLVRVRRREIRVLDAERLRRLGA